MDGWPFTGGFQSTNQSRSDAWAEGATFGDLRYGSAGNDWLLWAALAGLAAYVILK